MKLTVTNRLVPVVATAIIGVALMAGVGQYMSEKVYNSTSFANRNVIPSLLLLDDIHKNFLLSRSAAYNLFFNSTDLNHDQLIRQVNEHRQKVDEALGKYEFNGCYDVSCMADDTDKSLLYQEKALLADFNSDISQAIVESRKGQSIRAQGLYLDTAELTDKLQVLFEQHSKYNVIQGKRSADQAILDKSESFYLTLIIGAITILTISAMGYISTKSILNQLGGEPEDAAEIATRLALGDLTSHIRLRPGDSTSLMAKIRQLIDTMEKVADRADAIGRGNLADEVSVLSDQDRLGQAINHMVVALRSARTLDDRRNWLNNGNNLLSQALTGDFTTQQIAEIAMSTIGHYLHAGRGVFYLRRDDQATLELIASFMYTDDMHYRKTFRLGEGAIGQVALEQRPIILTTSTSNAALILTGTTSSLPVSTFTYPIVKDKKLLGVIEFSSLESFNETKLDFLSSAIDVIASFMTVAEQRGQIHGLLSVAEQAERDVRKQNEFLQEINSRMEEQQQQLQQQSEELQQTNAQMEEQQQLLEHNNEKLRQSEADINEKARQLELSNQYKSEFLANMSHELRTPLNAIILLSKMMMENPDGNLSDKEIKRAEVIHTSGHDLLGIINEVLDLSKVDAGRMEINVDEVSTRSISAELQDLFESIAHSNGIEFRIDDQYHGKFNSDHIKVGQILRNLLSNAFKFTKRGSVTLTIRQAPGEALPVRLSVKDTGIGIPKNKHKTIFDAFRQVDGSTSREYGGTGLGLTISLRFAELLGGQITLTSAEGQGSEFTLCLPEQPPEGAVAPLPAVRPQPMPTALRIEDDRDQLTHEDRIILLIDDDANFGMAVVDINRRLGYKTVVALTAADGLMLASRYHPAGILLDLGLPDRDGADVLQDLKTSPELASIPVYIISGRDHESAPDLNGIVGYLQKPLVSSQIEAAEAALLSAIGQVKSNGVLVFSSLVNNEVSRMLESGPTHYDLYKITTEAELQLKLARRDWGAAIIDLTHLELEQGLQVAAQIRAGRRDAAILFFGDHHFNDDEEASMRTYTDSIIIDAPQAILRLQENIARFLQQAKNPEPQPAVVTGHPEGIRNLTQKNILVIDDDPRNLFVITAALEQNQATIYNALNGRRAMELLESTPMDLIITDIMMPEMDGYQTIAAIRANPKLTSIPIIALTAKAMPEDKKNILEIGADDYLSKPVDYDVLCNMAALWSSTKHPS